jgi:hypothetical protein
MPNNTSSAQAFAAPVRNGSLAYRDVQETRMKTRLACLFVAIAPLFLPDLANACGNGAVQFADDFKTPDVGWIHNDQVKIGSGAITLMPVANRQETAYNNTYIFSDADICAQIKLNDFTKPEQLGGGLMFWIADLNNYYVFNIRPDGVWYIERQVGGRWIKINSGNSDVIKKAIGNLNEVEVRLSGNAGTGYVNGTKVATFNGQPPQGGGFFGVDAESENERANIWEFRNFRILKLQ